MFKYISLLLSIAIAGAGGIAVTSPSLQLDTNTSMQSQLNKDTNLENSDLFLSILQGGLNTNSDTDLQAQVQQNDIENNIEIESNADININSGENGSKEENIITEASYKSSTEVNSSLIYN